MKAIVVIALLIAMTGTARPCPPPPPDDDGSYRCAKYDRFYERLPAIEPVKVYVRDEKGSVPRRTKNVMKHLTSSAWRSRGGEATVETLQLFDGANVPDTYEAVDGARAVFVRTVEKIDHKVYVALDEGTFVVMRCKDGKRRRTCLVRVP